MTRSQTANLRHIRLEPAPGPKETPAEASYDFVAPLRDDGFIDLDAWKAQRALCFVHRMEKGGAQTRGLLVHRAGGAGGGSWVFDYELGEGEEETGYRFETHAFAPGSYASVRDTDGEAHTYRVVSVKPA